jgi:hypothetical protein
MSWDYTNAAGVEHDVAYYNKQPAAEWLENDPNDRVIRGHTLQNIQEKGGGWAG